MFEQRTRVRGLDELLRCRRLAGGGLPGDRRVIARLSSSDTVSPRVRRRIISDSLSATRVSQAPNLPTGS